MVFISQNEILPNLLTTGTFQENFDDTTYKNIEQTNSTGWGNNQIKNPNRSLEFIHRYSSTYLYANSFDMAGDLMIFNDAYNINIFNMSNPEYPTSIQRIFTSPFDRGIDIEGNIAYIATDLSGFFIYNFTIPGQMTKIASLFFGYGSTYDVQVDGNYAYVANRDNLIIVNVTNPSTPSVVTRINVNGVGSHITVDGDYLYFSCNDAGIAIFDISDVANPVWLSNYTSTDIGSTVIDGDIIYATSKVGLQIVNITDPSNPTLLMTFGSLWTTYIKLDGNNMFLSTNEGLHFYDITDPLYPVLIDTHTTYSIPCGEIMIKGDYVMVIVNYGFEIYRYRDRPIPNEIVFQPTTHYANAIYPHGNYLYLSDAYYFKIYDITNPRNPIHLKNIYTTPFDRGIAIAGNYMYVAYDTSGILIYDISDPINPVVVKQITGTTRIYELFIDGDTLYCAAGENGGLIVVDITNPASAYILKTYPLTGTAVQIIVDGDFAYLSNSAGGMTIFDVSNPKNPVILYTLTGSHVADIKVDGNIIYVADYYAGVKVLDVTNHRNPITIGMYTGINPAHLEVMGDYLWVSNGTNTFSLLDIQNPRNPILVATIGNMGTPREFMISGNFIFIVDYQRGLRVVEFASYERSSNFHPTSQAVSTTVYEELTGEITTARISPIYYTDKSSDISYYMTADGMNWELVNQGINHTFINTGQDLRWMAILYGNSTYSPIIYNITVVYYVYTIDPPVSTSNPPPSTSNPPPSTSNPPPSTSNPPPSTSNPPPSSSNPPPSSSNPPPSSSSPPPDPNSTTTTETNFWDSIDAPPMLNIVLSVVIVTVITKSKYRKFKKTK
ncbi:MAG: hypothetical protein OEY49_11060 [Candidatus Heimdallarchaeota archaeon]|nr:hypothetical protein [Candidatus Heimdallarchaeota archaeon]